MLAELVVLAAAASVALLLLVVHCCRRIERPPSPTEPLPVWAPRLPSGATKESPLERLRRVLLRLFSRRSRVEPAATSPDAQGEAVVTEQQVAAAAAAGPEEEVAAWRERWFGSPGSRALYTIEEESSTVTASDGDGEGESQNEGDHQHQEPETPFYTPAASPQREVENIS